MDNSGKIGSKSGLRLSKLRSGAAKRKAGCSTPKQVTAKKSEPMPNQCQNNEEVGPCFRQSEIGRVAKEGELFMLPFVIKFDTDAKISSNMSKEYN